MSRVLSGIKPTGKLTLGNYLGSFRNFHNYQDENETFIFVADLHALTLPIEPDYLNSNIYDIIAYYLASGLDPEKTILFKQSDIYEVSVLDTILINYIYMGELSRMIQYKEKVKELNNAKIGVGIFTYPVLMACDIFLYDSDIVPVGEDQRQHVELAHDIARRFNARYKGEYIKLPHTALPKAGKRIMNLADPSRKMSKSDDSAISKGVIYLEDNEKTIRKKIMSAVTDSDTKVIYDPTNKPGISNLINIYCAFKNVEVSEVEKQFEGANYGTFKKAVADAVLDELIPFKEKFNTYRQNKALLDQIFKDGASKARKIADKVLDRIMKVVGLR